MMILFVASKDLAEEIRALAREASPCDSTTMVASADSNENQSSRYIGPSEDATIHKPKLRLQERFPCGCHDQQYLVGALVADANGRDDVVLVLEFLPLPLVHVELAATEHVVQQTLRGATSEGDRRGKKNPVSDFSALDTRPFTEETPLRRYIHLVPLVIRKNRVPRRRVWHQRGKRRLPRT